MIIYTENEKYKVFYGVLSELFYVQFKDEAVDDKSFLFAADAIEYAEGKLISAGKV